VRIAAVVLVVAAVPAHAGPCKFHHDIGFLPAVLTPDHATLDPWGGVVVAAESVRLDHAVAGDPTLQDWRFSDGTHDVVAKRTVIAPGLITTAPVGLGDTLVFENADGSHALDVRYHTADRIALPAPKVESVVFSNTNLTIMLRELTMAKLAARPPAGVIALVVYAGATPRSWVAIDDPERLDLSVYAVDDCVRQIPGTIATRAGDRITLAWVDATGHVSVHTPTLVVGKR
jgi:hypothetical protein